MADFKPFMLSAEMIGHEGPVRAVQALPDGRLASASQDHTAKFWVPKKGDAGGVFYDMGDSLADHDHWVVSLAALASGALPECPEGGLVTGCMDKLVRVYDHRGKVQRLLQGHDGGVISLGWTASGQLISGSWDGTAKIWDLASGTCVLTLPGHENGVCVLGLPDGKVVTGSTGRQEGGQVVDFQIRIWSETGQKIKSARAHAGPVRSLDLAPGVGFQSTSNDGTARLWSLDGTPLGEMSHPATREGQPAFVLQGCVLAGNDGETVSVDESGGCIVWRGMEMGQSIAHPSGLWCVCALPNGDFATGCQDHVVRVWTRAPERAASEEVASAFDKGVIEGQTKVKQGPSAVEIAALPRWEQRHRTLGKSEGQVQVFQRDGKAIAAQWSAASSTWIEVGEVMGTSDGGVVDGETFDRVYPIEVEGAEGSVRKLEIGYNNGENPFMAAQRFVDKHELPQSYLGQIADYLTKRAGEATPTMGAETGGAQGASSGFSGVGDPTGFSSGTAPAVPGSGTSGGHPPSAHFPVTTYTTFETGALSKVEAKIREIDAGMEGEAGKMTSVDLKALSSLSATLSNGSRYHASKVTPEEMAMVLKLANWPVDKCFPCLDLCRLAALHPHVGEVLGRQDIGHGLNLLKSVARQCSEGKDKVSGARADGVSYTAGSLQKATALHGFESMEPQISSSLRRMPVVLCGLRFFANLFRHKVSRKLLLGNAALVLDAVSDQAGSGVDNKNVRLALATLFLNLAVAAHQEPLQPGLKDAYQQLTALYAEVLGETPGSGYPGDVLYRFLSGLGTLMTAGPLCVDIAKDLDLAASISSSLEGRTEENVSDCAKALLRILR